MNNRKTFGKVLGFIAKRGVLILISVVVVQILVNVFIHKSWDKVGETLINHGWIEIVSGILIYTLLERKIKQYGDVPIDDGRKDYDYILDGISRSKKTVRILDNDFASYFENSSHKTQDNLKERLKTCFYKCIISLEANQRIQILLLHPETLAAQQRNNDLQSDVFDLFERINEGLQFLQDFITNLGILTNAEMQLIKSDANLKKMIHSLENEYTATAATKIALLIRQQAFKSQIDDAEIDLEFICNFIQHNILEVRLFKASYSLVFVSWDDYMNFSVLPPREYSDKSTFRTLKHTQLANYFNNNFDEIWAEDERTIPLEMFKQVLIRTENNETIGKSIPWGDDNSEHNVPAFIYLSPQEAKIVEKNIGSNFQIIHDGAMKWARLEQIELGKNDNDDSKPDSNFRPASYYELARKQIMKKSNFEVVHGNKIYVVKYLHRQFKLSLIDEDYVVKHLQQKGYCYTSFNKYKVQFGLHVKTSLNSVYDFFIKRFNQHFSAEDRGDVAYKRLFAYYSSKVKPNGSIEVLNLDDAESFKNPTIRKKDIITNKALNSFIRSTIAADFYRVFGQKYFRNPKNDLYETQNIGDYLVRVIFIRTTVSPQVNVPDWYQDYFVENTAKFTILHFVGKRNVLGGIPFIWHDNEKPEREYNFQTPLDSIYFKNKHRYHGIEKPIKVDSSATTYFKFKDDDFGYRNLIAIEIFDRDEKVDF